MAVTAGLVVHHSTRVARNVLFAKPLTVGRILQLTGCFILTIIAILVVMWAAVWGMSTTHVSTVDPLSFPAPEGISFIPEIKHIALEKLTIWHAPRNLLSILSLQVIILGGLCLLYATYPIVSIIGVISSNWMMFGIATIMLFLAPVAYVSSQLMTLAAYVGLTVQVSTPAYVLFMVLIGLPASFLV